MRRSKSLEAYLDLRDNKSPNLESGALEYFLSFYIFDIATLNYLREASTTLSYRYTLAERSRSQYSHILLRIAIYF